MIGEKQALGKRFLGSNIGITGLGDLGHKIAKRIQAFDCGIGYYRRVQKDLLIDTLTASSIVQNLLMCCSYVFQELPKPII